MALGEAARKHSHAAQRRSTIELTPWTNEDDDVTWKLNTIRLSYQFMQHGDEDKEEPSVSTASEMWGTYGCGKHLQCRQTAAST